MNAGTARPRVNTLRPAWFPDLDFLGWISVAVICFWVTLALFAPWVAPYPENEIVSRVSFAPAGEVGLLGTDYLGRDLLSRIVFGARTTLGLALAATLIAFVFGVSLGFLAGLSGGWMDNALSRAFDVFVSFPQIMLALIVLSGLGSSLLVLVLVVAFVEGTRVFRIARALAMSTAAMDFIDVSRARGERMPWIMWNEILPNAVGPLATDFGLRFTYSILLLSALSFLGLGVQPPAADWGVMVKENLAGIAFGAPAAVLPALAIFSVTLAVNFLVDLGLARSQKTISSELLS